MRQLIVLAALLMIGFAAMGIARKTCAFGCPGIMCVNSAACGAGCACLIEGMDTSGVCVSIR